MNTKVTDKSGVPKNLFPRMCFQNCRTCYGSPCLLKNRHLIFVSAELVWKLNLVNKWIPRRKVRRKKVITLQLEKTSEVGVVFATRTSVSKCFWLLYCHYVFSGFRCVPDSSKMQISLPGTRVEKPRGRSVIWNQHSHVFAVRYPILTYLLHGAESFLRS